MPLAVTFLHITSSTTWYSNKEVNVHYKFVVSPNLEFQPNKWDWIGLYNVSLIVYNCTVKVMIFGDWLINLLFVCLLLIG